MKFKNEKEKIAALEALLFIHGEPMSHAKIAKVLGIPKTEAAEIIAALVSAYAEDARGIALLTEGEDVQLVTKPAFGSFVGEFLKEEMKEDLTPAALETLSLVSYLGPISRASIEYVRGVNSSFTLRNLRIRGLIDRAADPAGASSFLYSPSAAFLRHIGALKKEDLPEYEKFKHILAEDAHKESDAQTQEANKEKQQEL